MSSKNPIFDKIQTILDYKKQVILFGPPGTGKTYIANEFVKSHNFQNENGSSVKPGKKFYWYITNLENWGSGLKEMLEKNEEEGIWTKEDGDIDGRFLKDPSSFSNIKIGDIVFIYITPEKRMYGIAKCSRKEVDSAGDPVVSLRGLKYLEDGPRLEDIKSDPILKNAKRIHSNLGTLFPLSQEFGLRLLELAQVPIEEIGLTKTEEIERPLSQCNFITFHPAYAYEEFIEGLRPNRDESGNITYEIQEGIFKKSCREALNALLEIAEISRVWSDHEDIPQFTPEETDKIQRVASQAPRYFVIDEINRGDISRIFGELISLIESDKRLFSKNPLICLLPYSKMKFGIPPNLHIIGTMNTADRSISLMDIALRRRFGFIELLPDYEVLKQDLLNNESSLDTQVKDIRELSIQALQTVNINIQNLYDRDHQIGHSYLMKLSDVTTADETKEVLQNIWLYEIIPLLQEYFYDSPDKMGQVLNNRFVEKQGKSFTIRPETEIITALKAVVANKSLE